MKDTIVITSTLERATYYFERFCITYRDMIIKASKAQLKIKLSTGTTIYFRAETQGQRVLRGFHGKICVIDELKQELRDVAMGRKAKEE